jgi:hypothetical protein
MKRALSCEAIRRFALLLMPVSLLLIPSAPLVAEGDEERIVTHKFFADATPPPSAGGGSRVSRLEISVTRWTTDEEHAELAALLSGSSPIRLPRALRRQERTGSVRIRGGAPFHLHYARESREGDLRRIVLMADRPVLIGDFARHQRSTENPTTIITLEVDDESNGGGELIAGVRIAFDPELDSFASADRSPARVARLARVRRNR